VQIFVLDEADRMLDMGFIHDVRRIAKAIRSPHQSLLFSATMPDDISNLAGTILKEPVRVEVTPVASTVELVDQRVLFVDNANKRALLTALLGEPGIERVLVFTRTKHGANKVAEHLERSKINADAIHGNKTQGARQRALENFRNGRCRVLVATDIAARGIDIDGITHVVNFDLPNIPESYVHRIGRTARAGASGTALSFCGPDERGFLRDIERLTRHSLSVITDHPFVSATSAKPAAADEREGGRRSGNRGGGNRGNGHREGGHRGNGHREGGHRQGQSRGRRHEGGHHQAGRGHDAAVVGAGASEQAEHPRSAQQRPDRPREENRRGEHRRGEHHRGERHAGERAKGGQRQGERHQGGRPQGERHTEGNRDDRTGLNKVIGGAR
jgi:ATP-dependent RNA helicase RhlE